jgi:hypothetical protein
VKKFAMAVRKRGRLGEELWNAFCQPKVLLLHEPLPSLNGSELAELHELIMASVDEDSDKEGLFHLADRDLGGGFRSSN